MVLTEWERLLAPAGFKLHARRLESTLAPGLERLSLPRAQVFVIDAHVPQQATEVLVAGIRDRYPLARQMVVAENFSEASAFPLLRLGAKGIARLHRGERETGGSLARRCRRGVLGTPGFAFAVH